MHTQCSRICHSRSTHHPRNSSNPLTLNHHDGSNQALTAPGPESIDTAGMASLPPAAPSGFTDHTFKSASGIELAVRVWPAETPVDEPAPWVLW